MKILYHHRTRATDAQRVHIREIVNAFRGLGHEVEIVSLVDTEAVQDTGKKVSGPLDPAGRGSFRSSRSLTN